MIRGMNGYSQAQATNFTNVELPKLAPGGYVLAVQAVKIEDTQWGPRLAFKFEIAEGEQKGFFGKLYAATPKDWGDVKWKGTYRLKIPQNTGDAEKYAKSLGFFKSQLEAFEQSNPGLKINADGDWDEQMLARRYVGAIFNEKEYDWNGKTGFFTQCKRFVSVNDIRTGNFTVPKPDLLNRNGGAFNTFTGTGGGFNGGTSNGSGFSNFLASEIPPVPAGINNAPQGNPPVNVNNAPQGNPQGNVPAGVQMANQNFNPNTAYNTPANNVSGMQDFQVFGGDDGGVPF